MVAFLPNGVDFPRNTSAITARIQTAESSHTRAAAIHQNILKPPFNITSLIIAYGKESLVIANGKVQIG